MPSDVLAKQMRPSCQNVLPRRKPSSCSRGRAHVRLSQRCVAQDTRKSHQNFWQLVLKNCQCLKDQTRQNFQILSHEFGKLPLIDACIIETQIILTYGHLRQPSLAKLLSISPKNKSVGKKNNKGRLLKSIYLFVCGGMCVCLCVGGVYMCPCDCGHTYA